MKSITFETDVSQYTMNPDVKDEWVAALRSGEFEQGHKQLKSGSNSYCCLGVLCCLFGRHQDAYVDFEKDERGEWGFPDKSKPNSGKAYLLPPGSVYEWANLTVQGKKGRVFATVTPESGEPYEVTTGTPAGLLPSMNDTYGFTFAEIADYIEKYL